MFHPVEVVDSVEDASTASQRLKLSRADVFASEMGDYSYPG